MDESKRPIIIVKKKGDHGHHGGAWKVAFADFMTAMFALFLVLWILTQSQDVKAAVASYFRHPTDFEGKPDAQLKGNNGLMESRQGRMDQAPNMIQEAAKSDTPEGAGKQPDSVAGGLAQQDTADAGLRPPKPIERPEEQEKDEVRTFMNIADDLWMMLGMDTGFKKFKENLIIETIEDGLVVQLVNQANSPLFEEGSAEFKPLIKRVLNLLSKELGKYGNNKLEIDGHGDSLTRAYPASQKWLASGYMAELARIQLELGGLKPNQITKVAGCAVTRPLDEVNLNNPINTRISILVRPRQWRPERY